MNIAKNAKITRFISYVLIVALSLSSFSELAYAVDTSAAVVSEDEVTEEHITEKTESTTTYYLGNEKSMTVWHGSQVRFEDEDGNLIDYAPELEEIDAVKTEQDKSLNGYSFTNKEGDAKHYLPEKLEEEAPLIMEKEDYSIEMSLTDETLDMLGVSDSDAEVIKEEVQTIEGEEELPVTAVYENKESASVALTSMPGSVKETITLFEKPESNVFTYTLDLGNLTARKNILDEGITYYDIEEDRIAGFMQAPWMNDATGKNYSENIKCSLKETDKKGRYIVEMVIDEEYLSSNDTQYPVVIDPTNTWKGDSKLQDVYVISGSTYGDMNFYDSGTKKMPVGKNNTGYHRTFLKILNLKAQTLGKSVASAKLTVYETGSGESGQQIGVYRCDKSWTVTGITYNNRPGGATLYDTVTTKGTANTAHTFDIKAFAKNVANDSISNYGLMLYNKTESPGIGVFYGGRTTSTSYRPKLVVTYYSVPTTPTSADLNIKSGKSGSKVNKSVFVKDSTDATISFAGITSDGLKRVEQRIRYWNDDTQTRGDIATDYSENPDVINGGSMPSLSEGCYVNYVRGRNLADVAGGYKFGGYLHVDKTLPVINTYSLAPITSESAPTNNVRPTVSWKVTDKHFKSVSIIANGKIVKSGLTAREGSHTFKEGNTVITKSGVYEIKIRAYDKAGNYKDSRIVSYYVDVTPPEIAVFSAAPQTSVSSPSKNTTPSVRWTINDASLSQVELYLNGEKINDSEITPQVTTYIFKDGTLFSSGKNEIKIVATDVLGNRSEKTVGYFLDTQKPVIEGLTISPETSLLNPSNNKSPAVSWKVKEETAFDSIKYSLDGDSYLPMGSEAVGTFSIPSDAWISGAGSYTIYFKALDKAGNESDAATLTYRLGEGGTFKPSDLKCTEYYGKRIIRWEIDSYDSQAVAFDIHRSTEENFVPSEGTLLEADIDAASKMYIDSEILENRTYYYKIVVRNKTDESDVICSDEISILNTVTIESFKNTLGNKEYLSYEEVALPTSTAYIEKSSGNLVFSQNDYSISNAQLDYGMTRCYNSQSQYKSMVGKGWMDSYHKEIFKFGEDFYFVDSDGSVYLFEKDKSFECSETKNFAFAKTEKGYEITTKEDIVYKFNRYGQLLSVTEDNGCSITNTYDELGRLTAVTSKSTETEDRCLEFVYSNEEYLLKGIKDFTVTEYGYNFDNEKLVEAVIRKGSESVTYRHEYDTNSNLKCVKDGEDNSYLFAYENNKVKNATYPDGENFNFTYGNADENRGKCTVTKKNAGNDVIYTEETVFDIESGKLLSHKDPAGYETTYTYEGYLPKTVTTEIGYQSINDDNTILNESVQVTTTYTYDNEGNITNEVSTDGKESTYTYDDKNNLLSETEIVDGEEISGSTYTYDENGNILTATDSVDESIEEYTYNDDGNEVSSVAVDDEITVSKSSTEYDELGNPVKSTEYSGDIYSEENSVYDEMGRIISTTVDGITTTYEYDFLGREIKAVTSEEGKEDVTVCKTYDKNGSLISESQTGSVSKIYDYDNRNRYISTAVSGADMQTRTESIEYGYENNVVIHKGVKTRTESVLYTQTKKDTSGSVIEKTYIDKSGNTVRTSNGKIFTDRTFDASGNAFVSYTGNENDSKREITLSLYDEKGNNFATVKNPVVSESGFSLGENSIATYSNYDKKGNLLSETDGNGIKTIFSYDGEGRIIGCKVKDFVINYSETNDGTNDLNISYATNGKTVTATLIDANGNIKKETTNEAGLIVKTEDITGNENDGAENLSTEHAYDSLGRTVKEEYADNSYVLYEYVGNTENVALKTACRSNGTVESKVSYEYDIQDNPVKICKVDGSNNQISCIEYEYDAEGKVTLETVTYQGESAKKTEYEYDSEGRVILKKYLSDSNLGRVQYVYDSDGKITIVKKDGRLIREYVYDNMNRLESLKEYKTDGMFISKNYLYDSLNRVSSMTYSDGETVLESFEYEYDKNNNITEYIHVNNMLSDDKKINEKRTYSYDKYGNLTTSTITDRTDENSASETVTYEYDSVGNRISMSKDENTVSYSYNGLNQLVSSEQGGTETLYSYDARGNQIKETAVAGDTVVSENISEYAVTGELLSYEQSENGEAVLTQENIYNHNGQRIEKNENGIQKKYYYDNGSVAYIKEGEKVSSYILNAEGSVIGNIQNDEYSLYFKDVQGSTSSIVEEDGTLNAAYTYTDFGETLEIAGNDFDNEICYTGAVYDESTGLYYMNARYYDPENGRFISQDSYRGEKDDPGQWHLYTYCANNPINYIDPSGHKKVFIGWGIQLELSINSGYAGVQFVWLNDEIKKRYQGKKFHVYGYGGGSFSNDYKKRVKNHVKNKPKNLKTTGGLKKIQKLFKNHVSLTVCILTLWADTKKVNSYKKLEGEFVGITLIGYNATVSFGLGSTSATAGFGISTERKKSIALSVGNAKFLKKTTINCRKGLSKISNYVYGKAKKI